MKQLFFLLFIVFHFSLNSQTREKLIEKCVKDEISFIEKNRKHYDQVTLKEFIKIKQKSNETDSSFVIRLLAIDNNKLFIKSPEAETYFQKLDELLEKTSKKMGNLSDKEYQFYLSVVIKEKYGTLLIYHITLYAVAKAFIGAF